MTPFIIFTTALRFTLWTGFVTLNSRWDVILDLLAGRPDPRFISGGSLRDRAGRATPGAGARLRLPATIPTPILTGE